MLQEATQVSEEAPIEEDGPGTEEVDWHLQCAPKDDKGAPQLFDVPREGES